MCRWRTHLLALTLLVLALASPAAAQTTVPGLEKGDGLQSIDQAAFRLVDGDEWTRRGALIARLAAALPGVDVGGVLRDGNRKGRRIRRLFPVSGVRTGFKWSRGDDAVDYWYPQGITGTAAASSLGDAGGRKGLLVSWYHKVANDSRPYNMGVRISFCDVTSMKRVRYRHVLLVEPIERNGRADFRAVEVHAGGIAWYGRFLYVVDTRVGFRVFDLDRIFKVRTDRRSRIGRHQGRYYAYGYKYVLPQVNTYRLDRQGAEARFSFVSVDRSTAPHTLVSGEYERKSVQGKLLRWELDPATHRLLPRRGGIRPIEAYVSGQSKMQGALSWRGRFYVACSSQKRFGFWGRSYGKLYRLTPGHSRGFLWAYGPEDLTYAPRSGNLWSLTEHPGSRAVFAVKRSRY